MAYQSRLYALVKLLVQHKANYQLIFEHATLQDVCQINCVAVVKNFLHAITNKTHVDYEAALEVVMQTCNTDLTKFFLDQLETSIFGEGLANALKVACGAGSQDMVCLLIQYDRELVKSIQHDSSDSCSHPLCIAIRNSDIDIAVTLCKSTAQLFNIMASSSENPQCHMLCQSSLGNLCSRQDEFSDILPMLIHEDTAQQSLDYALIAACKSACTRATRLLLSKSADVNGCHEGVTPLHAALEARSSEVVDLLLDAGADPNRANSEHKAPLCVACDVEHYEIATKLVDAGANTNPESNSPLLTACQHNYLDIVHMLLDNKANPNQSSSDRHILHSAHKAKHYEAARLLMEYGADPSVLTDVDLRSACELGYTETAQYLVQEGEMMTHYMLDLCIEAAYRNGFLTTIYEVCIDITDEKLHDYSMQKAHDLQGTTTFTKEPSTLKHTNVPKNNNSLWQCLAQRDITRMRGLIKEGADINSPNVAGRSFLQECIQHGIPHVIPDLCNAPTKIQINYQDNSGRTALFYSLTCPYIFKIQDKPISVYEYLVSKGADMNIRDHFGRSLLHEWEPISDGTRCGPSVETLIQHLDINSTDYKGQTALHLAVLNNNTVKVKQLKKNGANVKACDINGITPFSLAKRNSDTEDTSQCVHMLQDKSKQHRLVPRLKTVFHERTKYTRIANFTTRYAVPVNYTMQASIQDEMLLFKETVLEMLKEINAMVTQEEPVLSFSPRLSGSCAEGTKVIAMDEADMLCVFDNDIWKHVTLSPVSNDARIQDNPSFVQLMSGVLSTKHPHLLNGTVISKQKLLMRLYSLIRKALPTVLKKINQLYMIDVKNTVANDHSLACLSMVWHGKELNWQEFTVDIVPAIPVTQEQLPDVTRKVVRHSQIIEDLFVVPKTGTFDQSQNDTAFRLSFSSTERDLFLAMPAALKQGYMLTKVLVHDCVTIDSIRPAMCSYNLKTATFECFKAEVLNWEDMVRQARMSGKMTENQAKAEHVVNHAQNILQKLENDFTQKHQDSFFLKGCDLMIHSIDKNDYRQVLYVKYCKALLCDADDVAWQELAEDVAQQLLRSENLHERYFTEETEMLLDMGLRSLRNSMLGMMIKVGQVAGVRMLLERGASVENLDGNGTSALQLAEAKDVQSFLQENTRGNMPLYYYSLALG